MFAGEDLRKLISTLQGTNKDLSHRIKQLTVEHAELAAILKEMVEGVMVVDPRGRIRLVNKAMEEMFGIRGEEAVGRPAIELVRHQSMIHLITEVLENQVNVAREVTFAMPEEKTYRVQASVAGAEGENHTFGAIFVFHDITELRRLERVRKDFVANVSHELRTPMTSIKGYIEVLLEEFEEEPPKRREFLEILKNQTDRMNNIISDLLILSQIESGRYQWRREEIAIRPWLLRSVEPFRPLASSKKLSLTVDIPEDIGTLTGDPEKLTQIVSNLLDNAIKYSPEGGKIGVRALFSPREVDILVEDTGIGIPPKELTRIFERFYRVDRARSREMGGTGLGLSIVKHVAEAHGGQVSVESTPGKGSLFTVRLPRTLSSLEL
ncbi:MAG: phosphate regulon sensor histidine kinase PhoR [Nitrospirae bacterium]|nr:phosphate regulon sensor histidine kinase PhoR [Nitrospirota bacterium]